MAEKKSKSEMDTGFDAQPLYLERKKQREAIRTGEEGSLKAKRVKDDEDKKKAEKDA